METSVQILADSISPDGVRLTTLELVYPRFIHSEMLRHRMFSHSVASSRAIPTEKNIEQVKTDPFIPATFNKRVKGMGVGEELDEKAQEWSRDSWIKASLSAARHAEDLNNLGIDKSRANRLLEPFLYVVDIVSATEWDNFFALRDHSAAQPEFQHLAKEMRMAMKESVETGTLEPLEYGQWHLPLVEDRDRDERAAERAGGRLSIEDIKKLSASRCARVSFQKQHESEPIEKTIGRADMLIASGHLSPFEHVARPMTEADDVINEDGIEPYTGYANHHVSRLFCGNFRGWVQMRQEIPNQDDFGKVIADERTS